MPSKMPIPLIANCYNMCLDSRTLRRVSPIRPLPLYSLDLSVAVRGRLITNYAYILC